MSDWCERWKTWSIGCENTKLEHSLAFCCHRPFAAVGHGSFVQTIFPFASLSLILFTPISIVRKFFLQFLLFYFCSAVVAPTGSESTAWHRKAIGHGHRPFLAIFRIDNGRQTTMLFYDRCKPCTKGILQPDEWNVRYNNNKKKRATLACRGRTIDRHYTHTQNIRTHKLDKVTL